MCRGGGVEGEGVDRKVLRGEGVDREGVEGEGVEGKC